MNNVNMIGRITKDLELKMSSEGKEILNFSIAWNDRKKVGHFFNCVSFGVTAKNINQYFSKGSLIGISGILVNNNWTDKDGNKRYSNEIIVNEFSFCDSKNSQSLDSADTPTFSNEVPAPEKNPFSDSDIPF